MSFITSCPSCGTKFRVVADQLRISDGWVRCGRCQEVFDAQAALEAQALAATPAMSAPAAPSDVAQSLAPTVEMVLTQLHALDADAKEDVQTAADTLAQTGAAMQQYPATPSSVAEVLITSPSVASGVAAFEGYELPAPAALDPDFELEVPDTRMAGSGDWQDVAVASAENLEREPLLRNEPDMEALVTAPTARPVLDFWEQQAALTAEESQAHIWAEAFDDRGREVIQQPAEVLLQAQAVTDADHSEPEQVPGFIKQAQRKAWWNQPGVRFAMGMLLMFLPIALLVQVVVHERNLIVAWKPQLRAPMQAMCAALRCEIAPHKNIAAVVLTGSAFVQEAQPNHYKLDLSIQNQDAITVATPALELTLTDAQDQVLVRKVFNPAEMGAPAEMAARSEWTGTLPLVTKGLDLPVAGYRVMAFYP